MILVFVVKRPVDDNDKAVYIVKKSSWLLIIISSSNRIDGFIV